MEITLDEVLWNSSDRDTLAQFLNTTSGAKLLPKLAEMAPALLPKGDTNEILIRSGTLLGTQEVIKNILSLARPEPAVPQHVEAYPAPEDDSQWQDGKSLKQ